MAVALALDMDPPMHYMHMLAMFFSGSKQSDTRTISSSEVSIYYSMLPNILMLVFLKEVVIKVGTTHLGMLPCRWSDTKGPDAHGGILDGSILDGSLQQWPSGWFHLEMPLLVVHTIEAAYLGYSIISLVCHWSMSSNKQVRQKASLQTIKRHLV